MSECRICRDHGFPGIMIAWDNNIKTKNGRFVPLEPDKTTPHKHYEPTTTSTTNISKTGCVLNTQLQQALLQRLKDIEHSVNELTAFVEGTEM